MHLKSLHRKSVPNTYASVRATEFHVKRGWGDATYSPRRSIASRAFFRSIPQR